MQRMLKPQKPKTTAHVRRCPVRTAAGGVQVGLLRVRNRLASQLSGGMKRRLSIAIALIGTAHTPLAPNVGFVPES